MACSVSPERAEIDRICRLPGSETDMRCRKKPQPKTRKEMMVDHIEICRVRGLDKECYWVRRGELNRVLREMGF
jgi:hypothetical protein